MSNGVVKLMGLFGESAIHEEPYSLAHNRMIVDFAIKEDGWVYAIDQEGAVLACSSANAKTFHKIILPRNRLSGMSLAGGNGPCYAYETNPEGKLSFYELQG